MGKDLSFKSITCCKEHKSIRYSFMKKEELFMTEILFKFIRIFVDKKIKVPAVILCPYVNFSKDPRDGIPRGHHPIQNLRYIDSQKHGGRKIG
jgi:hypothetical protein